MSTLAKDSFTDANGTTLAHHAMDVGAGWATALVLGGPGTFKIQSDESYYTAPPGDSGIAVDVGQSDYTLQCDVIPGDANGNCGVFFRVQDANNLWMARWRTSAPQYVEIYERSGSSWTRQATATLSGTAGQSYTIVAVLSGTSIQATVSSTTASCTSSDFETKTKCGLYGTATGDSHDNFLVTNTAADTFGGIPAVIAFNELTVPQIEE